MALVIDYDKASNERLLNLMKLNDAALLKKHITPEMADKITLQEVIYFFCTYTKSSDDKEKFKALNIYASEFNLKKFFLKVIIKHIYSLQNIIQISEIFKQNTDEINTDLKQEQIEKILEKKNNDVEAPIDSDIRFKNLLYNLITNNIYWDKINNTTFNEITLEELTVFLSRYNHNIDFQAFGFDTSEKNPKKLLFDVVNKYQVYIETIKNASDILRKNANSIGSIMDFKTLFEDDTINDDVADEVINRLLIKDDTDTLTSRSSTGSSMGTLTSRSSTNDWLSTLRSQIEYDQNYTPRISPKPRKEPQSQDKLPIVLDAIESSPPGTEYENLRQELINTINDADALYAMEALALEHENWAREHYETGIKDVPQEFISKKMLLTLYYKFLNLKYTIKETSLVAEMKAEEINIKLMRLTGNDAQLKTSEEKNKKKRREYAEGKRQQLQESTNLKEAQAESTKEIKEKEEELKKAAEEAAAAEIAAETETAKTSPNQLLILRLKEHALKLKIKELMLKCLVEFTKFLENSSDQICFDIIKSHAKSDEAKKKAMDNTAAGNDAYKKVREKEKQRFEIEQQIFKLTNAKIKTFEELEGEITKLMLTNQEIKTLQNQKNELKNKAETESLKIDQAEQDTLTAEAEAENEIKINSTASNTLQFKIAALELKLVELSLKLEIDNYLIKEIMVNKELLLKIQDEKLINDDFKEIIAASIQTNDINDLALIIKSKELEEEIKIIQDQIKVIEAQIIDIEKRPPPPSLPPSLPIGGLLPPAASTTTEKLEDSTNLEDLTEFTNKKKIMFDQVTAKITQLKIEIHRNFRLLIQNAFENKTGFDKYITDINIAFNEVSSKKKKLDEIKEELTKILDKLKNDADTITVSKTDTRVADGGTFRLYERQLTTLLDGLVKNKNSTYNEHIEIIKELEYMNEYANKLKDTKFKSILNLIYTNFTSLLGSLLGTKLENKKEMIQPKDLKKILEKEEFTQLLILPTLSDLSFLSNEEEEKYIKNNKLLLYWKLNNLKKIIMGYCLILDDYYQLKDYEENEHFDYKEYQDTRRSLTLNIINYIKLLFENPDDEKLFFIQFKNDIGFKFLGEYVTILYNLVKPHSSLLTKKTNIESSDIIYLETNFKKNLEKTKSDPGMTIFNDSEALFEFLHKIKNKTIINNNQIPEISSITSPSSPSNLFGSPINKLIKMIHDIYTSLENVGNKYGWLNYVRKGGDSSKTLKKKQLKRKKTHKNY